MINKDGKKVSTKPWNTKEWKELRKKLIKDKCEQCGSTEDLVLQHLWQPPTLGSLKYKMIREMFNDLIDNLTDSARESYTKKAQDTVNGLLDGDILNKREKASLKKKWELHQDKYIRDFIYEGFIKEKNEEIYAKAIEQSKENHKRYMSCKDTVTFCKKCAFLWDEKEQKLCPDCKVRYCDIKMSLCDVCSGTKRLCVKCNRNYHYSIYPTCFDCSSKKQKWLKIEKELEDSRKGFEIGECLVDVCDCKPECPVIGYLYTDGSGGGHSYKCNIEEVIKKYPGVIKIDNE